MVTIISNYLINNPYKLTSLNTFAKKSTNLLNHRFQRTSIIGDALKSKSVIFRLWLEQVVALFYHQSQAINKEMIADLWLSSWPYLARWLYLPVWFAQYTCHFEKYWAHHCQSFMDQKIDAVMTVATRCTRRVVSSVFLVIVRRDLKNRSSSSQHQLLFPRVPAVTAHWEKCSFQNAVCLDRGWLFERRRNGQQDD